MKKLVLTAMLGSSLLAKNIKTIQFDGLIHLSEPTARELININDGDVFNIDKIDTSIKKLYKQEYFKDIWVTEEKGVLTYHFKEKPVVSKVEVENFADNDEEKRNSVKRIKKGSLYSLKRIEDTKKAIIENLSRDGYIDSVVEAKTKEAKNGSIEITFIVKTGENITIENIDFIGLKAFDKDEVMDELANREHEFMGWFIGRNDGEAQIEELELDKLRLKDFYMRNGYLDVEVKSPLLTVNFDNYTANMVYNIAEGIQYKFKDIQITQTKEVIENEKLYEDLKFKKGKVFNIETFRKALQSIKNKVADKGYAYAQVLPNLKKNKESGEVEVFVTVKPGKKVYINNVEITGNSRTLDRVIRREVYLAPGDLYSLTDMKDSKSALKRAGYFEKVNVEERRVSETLIDIVVTVEEAPTGTLRLGGGYGSYDGFILDASVSDRNIFGSGKELGINVSTSSKSTSSSVSLKNPRVNDSLFSLSGTVFKNEYDYNDYDLDRLGFTSTLGRRLTRTLSSSLTYGYSTNDYSNVSSTVTNPNNYLDYKKSSLTPALSYNSTDDYFIPREGIRATTSLEFAGIGGQADFVKYYASFATFKSLEDYIDADLILRYKARFGYIFDTGYAPTNERFTMGGVGTVRGYNRYSLTPEDSKGNDVGGDLTLTNSAELSFPIIPKAKLRGALFVDYGWIGEDTLTQINRGGYGGVIEWFSPVGPIQFIFAKPFNDKPGDDDAFFEFTIGQRF